MKVLWFTLTPSLAENLLNNIPMGCGWVKSLENEVQDKVDLSIAFYHDKEVKPFTHGRTTYYPIFNRNRGFFFKIIKKIFVKLEADSDTNKFLNVVETVKPDLIHIHGTESPFGLVQKHISIPTVISIQGNISVYKYKYFSGISFLNILKYSNFKSRIFLKTFNKKYSYFKKQALREKKIFKITKNVIGRTSWDRRLSKVLAPNSNYFHNDEILRDTFYLNKWNNNQDDQLNLFTTNGPNIYKGIETLIYCASLLDLNKINYKWNVAGLNHNDEIVKIASKSIDKKVSDNIRFLGKVNEQTLVEELLNTNIYIATSHIENSPNSLCEAQILGVPCIATNAGGTASLLKDGIDGILIQDGDPYAMAGAIIELKENYTQAITYGNNSREKALKRHDKKKITNYLLDIYNDILNNNRTK